MSSFRAKFKRKSDDKVLDVWCIDDYFGRHRYGYILINEDKPAMNEDEFGKEFERVFEE